MSQSVAKLAVELVGKDAGVRKMLDGVKKDGKTAFSGVAIGAGTASLAIAGVATAGAGAVAIMSRIATESAAVGRELQAQAVASNSTVQSIQEIGYATESVGIDAAKAADIFKDFQDKLGDFRSTGGGAFADFFEQVGDKIGVTADQLARMAGPDALVAVKKAMDDANVSADRQIFYLEALAGDAARLTPLLENNGERFREMVDRYRELDVALTDSQIDKFKEYDQDVKDLQLAWDSLTRETVLPFVGLLADGAHWMTELFSTTRNERMADIKEQISDLNAEITDLLANGKKYGGGVTGMMDAILGDSSTKGERIAKRQAEVRRLKAELEELNAPSSGSLVSGYEPPVLTDIGAAPDSKSATRLATEQNRGATLLAQLDQQYANEQEKLQLNLFKQLEQIESMKLSEAEIHKRGYDTLDQLKLDYEAKSHTNYQLELEQIDLREQDKQLREQERVLQEFESIREQFLTRDQVEQEAYTRRQEILNNALNTKLIEEQKHQQLSAKNWAKYQDEIAKSERATQMMQLQGYGSMFGSLADITKAFAGEQSGAYKAMFAVSKAFSIAQSIVAIQQGIAQAAANPWPLNLAAMASVAASTASIISTIQGTNLTGMAHDGIDTIPQEGTWLLQKGERVINAKQNEKITDAISGGKGGGGGVTVNIVPNPDRAGETEESGSGNQRELTIYVNATLNELNQRIARGGNAESRTFEGTYGLSRAAGARR